MSRFLGRILILFLCLGGTPQIAHADSPPLPLVDYRAATGVAAEALLAGATGEAFLLYYLSEHGVGHPSVVVWLQKPTAAGAAMATLYTAPPGQITVPVTLTSMGVVVEPTLRPSLTISAIDGWWVREGITNYNLDMKVYAPAYAMWGGVENPIQAPTSWQANLVPGEVAVTIAVRDRDGDGQPDWEWRELVPPFPGKGYYRTHYAESPCAPRRTVVPGVTTLFPYLAETGSFEQPAGEFHPPFIVQWAEGQLTHIREMVAVRNTPCSYAFYSVSPLIHNTHNHPNFETPFAFYDLGDTGSDLPNLSLRTERYPMQDPWSLGIDPTVQGGIRPVPSDVETIRYSWRTAPGDRRWDYKVEMLGFLPYTATTPIGDGQTTIDAPSYGDFPAWTLTREWPVVTFVAAEARAYESTEGIYEWSPFELGIGYIFGWHDRPKGESLQRIPPGLRGEYRYTTTGRPLLYFSQVDQRLHLKGAEGGLWNLGTEGQVRLHSSVNTYIDGWTRHGEDSTAPPEESLYVLDGYLLYAGGGRVILKQIEVPLSDFTIMPPHDSASWNAFIAKLNEKAATTRPGNNLYNWFESYAGATVTLPATTLQTVRTGADGYQFILHIARTTTVNIPWFRQGDLHVGNYQLTQGDSFALTPVTTSPPTLALSVDAASLPSVRVIVTNPATYATEALRIRATAMNEDESIILLDQSVQLEGGTQYKTHITWLAPTSDTWQVEVQLEDSAGQIITKQTLPWTTISSVATPLAVWDISAPAAWVLGIQAVLIGIMVLALGVVLHQVRTSSSL